MADNRYNRNNEVISVSDGLATFLEVYRLKKKYTSAQIINLWNEINGKIVEKATLNIYVHDQVLHVSIDSAPLKHHLHYNKKLILEKINAAIATSECLKDLVVI
ncbi:MAG: DUF721 domain-containing protein [Cytophagales bacterium]|nr:DUF721 domain-containing protein [Cytophagales bacterium]